ncbi:MAG: rhomboid family intramembrane serine protease [Defluviitaleaceae bacterium]|nr:rhomboid family intramembrane serine protease [Defluviitaleaceae bacterium]
MDFFTRLYSDIVKNGFSAGHINSYGHPLASFTKEEGSTWHVLLIANLEAITFEEFMVANRRYTRFYTNLPEEKRPNNIFVTNILITQDDNQDINNFIQNLAPFSPNIVNNIFWSLNLTSGMLLLNEEQPTEILNLRKILEDCYQNRVPTIAPINYQTAKASSLTLVVIILNIIMYMIVLLNGGITTANLVRFGALLPPQYINGEYFRLFSAMFLHAGSFHLFLNMFSLYIFGTRVERHYGRSAFAVIYTFAGFAGSLASFTLQQSISVGASGAIFGLAGAVAVMAKSTGRDLDGLNFQTMLMFIIINLAFGFTLPNVDNFGHLGGLFGGVISGYVLCKMILRKG